MNNLFTGMIFVFLGFNITFGNSKFDILPDFIGFYLIFKGLEELQDKSDNFTKIKSFAFGLTIYSFVLFIINLFAASYSMGYLGILLGIAYTIILIYVSYKIILGIIDIEINHNVFLNSQKLMSNWRIMITFNILIFFILFIPFISIVFIILNIVFTILYLISFNESKNLYYQNNII